MKKILVIEDEPEMRRNIAALLRYKEYEPVAAENGRLGLELARREKPDLILCDVMMPELDGYGVLAALQEDRKDYELLQEAVDRYLESRQGRG